MWSCLYILQSPHTPLCSLLDRVRVIMGGHPSLDFNLNADFPHGERSKMASSSMGSNHAEEEKAAVEEEQRIEVLKAELARVTEENKKLNDMLESVSWNYAVLRNKMNDTTSAATAASSERGGGSPSPSSPSPSPTMPKRKSSQVCSVNRMDCSSGGEEHCNPNWNKPMRGDDGAWKRGVRKLYFRTDPKDSSPVVRDGYQWRKYGQKVTRDNPFPRAYFRCSFAPSCPVKKKVQRSKEDAAMLEATYEGEHNHGQRDASHSHLAASPCRNSSNPNSSPPDHVRLGQDGGDDVSMRRGLAEEMARSLTEDPTFTDALAAAISGRMAQASSFRLL